MARRYLKVVGLLVILLGVFLATVVAAQAKAGTGLGMSMLKLVAGHDEGVQLSEAPAMNGMSDGGCGMSCGEASTGATCGAGAAAETSGAGAAAETSGAGEASEAGAGAQEVTPTCASGAAGMDCGSKGMAPTCGADRSCGFEAEAGESAAPEAVPDSIPAK